MSRILTLLPVSDVQQDLTVIIEAANALGFEVLPTATVEDAEQKVTQLSPDLIVLDNPNNALVSLPAAVSTVLLTCDNSPEFLGKQIDKGISDFIFTPINASLLRHTLAQQKQMIEQSDLQQRFDRQTLKLHEMGELVGLISHEVASPIGNVNTAVSFLLESSQKVHAAFDEKILAANDLERFLKQTNKALSMSIKNADNAGGIISSFRSVATSQCIEKVGQFYVHRFIDEIVLTLKSKLKKLPHDIHVVVNESIDLVSDPGAFSQVINGLINKSITHGFDDNDPGLIIINAALEKRDEVSTLVLNYIDNGCGLTSEQVESILIDDKASTSNSLTTAMLKKIVEQQLLGTMEVESTEGSGLHYTVTIPQSIG